MKTTTKRVFQVLLFCLLAAMLSLGTAMATSAAEVQSGALAAGYHVGAEDSQYTLEASGNGWKIKNSNNQYLKANYSSNFNARSISFDNQGTVLTINNYSQNQGWSVYYNYDAGWSSQSVYLSLSGSSFSFGDENSKIKIYSSGGGSTEPTTEPTTDVPEETQPATTESKIEYSKTIEHIGNEDEYNYRLHLTIDGENLASTTTVPGEPVKERKIGILLDVTETMLSTWSGSENGADNKFDGVRKLLQGNDGFLNSILDGHTEVYIIVVGGQSGSGTYLELSDKIASGKTLGDFSNINNSLHVAQGISYVTGLKAAEYYLGNDIDSLVYIVGNETDTYVDYATGNLERGTTGTSAKTKNYSDYVTFMGNHPELSMYMLYVTPTNRGSDIAQQMGAYSVSRGTGGGYYEANNAATLKDKLTQISEEIKIPGDVTKSLTVVDTLSDKVEFTGSSRTAISLTATMWLGNKEGAGTDVSNKVIPDFENKTVTFSGYDTIDGKFYLEIAFNIKTADDVFHESTYPNIGDEYTDYGTNNTTSSNQPGYFSNVKKSSTISYTLNNEPTRTAEFKQPVVQAPEPQDGVYKFTYPDRNEIYYYGKDNPNGSDDGYFAYQMYTKTVTRRLRSAEIRGYSGNDNQEGVPTYLWTEEAQALFDGKNPLVTASFEVQGNEYNYDNVSFYKHDIVWPTMIITELPANQSIKVDGSDVVVTAEAPEKTFTFKYVLVQNGQENEFAEKVKYAENVTFNPAYKGQEGIHVIEGVTLPENLTYWSSDAAGEHILTTVKTFGMLIRGGYTENDLKNDVVTVYAQTKAPEGEAFQPFIEEATLTRVIADNEVNRYYADYMVDYLNINGVVVQDMLDESKTVSYGLVVLVSDNAAEQEKMQKVAKVMADGNKNAAYIGSTGNDIAYRFEYNDAAHISDYNRTLFTIDGKYENLKGKTLTAIAYIVVTDADTQEKKYYYTPVNTDIVVKRDDENP